MYQYACTLSVIVNLTVCTGQCFVYGQVHSEPSKIFTDEDLHVYWNLRINNNSTDLAQHRLAWVLTVFFCSSAMDIKELKFLDINTINKAKSGQEVATEPSVVSAGCHGQSNRNTHSHATSNSSQSRTTPITILRRGR